MATWELIITGCGTSHGNPAWGYPEHWSEDPRDHRRRSGAILKGPNAEVILIDAGPDLMYQLRDPYKNVNDFAYPQECITRCDAVLLTHDHADHCHGLNDLRHLNRLMKTEIPVYGHRMHLDAVQAMFPYCFAAADAIYTRGSPALQAVPIDDFQRYEIAGLPVTQLPLDHGPGGRTSGFRINGMAYLTDLKLLPSESEEQLQGLSLLVLDMLREELHPTHLAWSEALQILERLQPQRCILTHMGHEVQYKEWLERLPENVTMAYDGLHVQFEAE